MEKMPGFEGKTTTYNREAVAMSAQEEALGLLEERMPGIMDMAAAEKIPVLKELLAELSVTVEGTDIPQHNEYRHVVESLSRLLVIEEAQQQIDSLMARYPEFV